MSATPLTSPLDVPAHRTDSARVMPPRVDTVAAPSRPAVAAHPAGRGNYRAAEAGSVPVFVPLLIFFGAGLAWAVFQAVQLHEESKSLQSLKAGQEQQVQQAQRVRQTLDVLASETKRLADAGNPNARLVIEELGKRGITVNPAAPPAPAPAR